MVRGAARALSVVVVCVVGLAGCASNPAHEEASASAGRALTVMAELPVVPADAAAARVVGGEPGTDGIELMSAQGTNRSGKVVLRISKHAPDTSGVEPREVSFTGCWAVDFSRLMDDAAPTEVSCPTTAPLTPTPATVSLPDDPFAQPGG